MKFQDVWSRWFTGTAEVGESGKPQEGKLLSPSVGRGLAGLAVFGALLLLLGRTTETEQQVAGSVEQPAASTAASVAPTRLEDTMARSLRSFLAQMDGVGSVDVYITLDHSAEQVVAEEVTSQKTVSNGERQGVNSTDIRETRRPVTVRDDVARAERPLVLVQKEPTIRGVVVIADGGSVPQIRYNLARAVETALGVPLHRIAVFPRE